MPKINPIVQFLTLLLGLLVVSFVAHTMVLDMGGYPKYDHHIILSYAVNGLLAALIFISLYLFRITLKNSIGFLFLVGSLIKFVVFFALFYPSYNADGDMSKFEFAAFFVPYAICLILETFFTAKMLQKLD